MANEILKFAENGTTANDLLTQSEYQSDAQRLIGNQPGIARAKLVNKVLRQCAFISNAFAEYIISKAGGDVLDNNDSTALIAKITTAFTYTFTNDNYIINGNFDFWQRNTSFNVSVNNTYTADRWVNGLAGTTAVISRQATALTEAFNARFFLRATTTSVAGIANFNALTHRHENVRVLAGKQVTISFWAKADSARNMSLEFVQNFGTGGTPSAEVTTLGVQKFAITTSWQKFTRTVTLPSISGKIIGTNENSSTGVNFWFDAGANYNTRTDSLGQQSGTFDIAQVKLEDGATASAFTLAGKSLANELKACKRYYEKSYPVDVVPGTALFGGSFQSVTLNGGDFYDLFNRRFAVEKRALPTIVFWAPGTTNISGAFSLLTGASTGVPTVRPDSLGVNGLSISNSGTALAANTAHTVHYTADAEI